MVAGLVYCLHRQQRDTAAMAATTRVTLTNQQLVLIVTALNHLDPAIACVVAGKDANDVLDALAARLETKCEVEA